jgi:hypothetical protein
MFLLSSFSTSTLSMLLPYQISGLPKRYHTFFSPVYFHVCPCVSNLLTLISPSKWSPELTLQSIQCQLSTCAVTYHHTLHLPLRYHIPNMVKYAFTSALSIRCVSWGKRLWVVSQLLPVPSTSPCACEVLNNRNDVVKRETIFAICHLPVSLSSQEAGGEGNTVLADCCSSTQHVLISCYARHFHIISSLGQFNPIVRKAFFLSFSFSFFLPSFLPFFFFFCSTGVWTQGLMLARSMVN